MAVTLDATAVPAPVVPGTANYMADQESTSGTPATSLSFTSGNLGAQVSSKMNRNATGYDQQSVYGGGGYGIGSGLALSAGTGLAVIAADGQALIGGMVELREGTAGTTAVVGTSTTAWVWLKQDGSLAVQNGTTAKPSGNCCLLGAALTNASAVTAIETAGVVYFRSGMPYRETNDTGIPGDSPDSTLRLYTKTQGGTYLWDGVAHRLQPGTKTRVGAIASKTSVVDGDQYFPNDGPYIYVRDTTLKPWGPVYPMTEPVDSEWSWINQGSATVTTAAGGILMFAPFQTGTNLRLRAQNVPTGAYTATFGFHCLSYEQNNLDVFVGWGDGTKFVGLRMNKSQYRLTKANTTASYNSDYNAFSNFAPRSAPLHWVRLIDNATNRIVQTSINGQYWDPLHTVTRTDFLTATQLVFGMNPDDTNTEHNMMLHLLHYKEE